MRQASCGQALPTCSARKVFGSRCGRRCHRVVVKAEMMTTSPATQDRDKPAWTGDSVLSRVVNWAIDTPPLYGAMKVLAKKAMKSSAEGRGVRWDSLVREMAELKELEALRKELEDPSLSYPAYYLKPFHAYETGNLEWLAAYEVEPATYAMGIRTFKEQPDWSWDKCFVELRARVTDAIKAYHAQHGLPSPTSIVDMGCSTGLSTRWLAAQFPAAQVTGLDLSPYFLAVAELERRRAVAGGPPAPSQQVGVPQPMAPPPSGSNIRYMHGLAEKSPFESNSLDMVNFNFVIHECPQDAIRSFVVESMRVLKPGGVVAFVDNNPKSKTIQNLPAPIFTLMKSTEPWSDEYYSFDLEACMRSEGFLEVVTVETDHRHRAVMGIKPK